MTASNRSTDSCIASGNKSLIADCALLGVGVPTIDGMGHRGLVYYYMGSTESRGSKSRLDKEYKLIRRFVSDLYGGSEITVVEHKQTRCQFALKEFVLQFSSEKLTSQLEAHRQLSHQNLIQLTTFWCEHDLNICSSLLKVYAILEYYETSLEDLLAEESEELGDREVADFVGQMGAALAFLQRNRLEYLLAGPKSIAVVDRTALQELEAKEKGLNSHRKSVSHLFEESKSFHRRSLIEINRDYFRPSLQVDSPTSKKVYKIVDPLEGVSSSRSCHNLQNYLQVPLHPSLALSQDTLVSDAMIKQQNAITVTLIALSMCLHSDVVDFDIFAYGRLSLEKLAAKVEELKKSHPRTAKEILKTFGSPLAALPARISQGLKIKDVALVRRRRESKISLILQEDKENLGQERERALGQTEKGVGKTVLHRTASKRISLLQL